MNSLRRRLLPAVLIAALALPPAAVAAPQAPADPALHQLVGADETIAPAGEEVVISAGHADLGPLITVDGVDVLVRDDTADPPVWRHLDDVVFEVSDAAAQTLPPGDAFDFTGAAGGEQVWVVPQTEVAGVPWLGWNTQSPALVGAADRGVTLEFAGHSGPGQFSLFLQNGGFEPPQQLWNSAAEGTQPMWVELNTHTHANWVFSEPGIHQVAVTAVVPLLDGTTLRDTEVVTLAVGSGADVAAAQGTEWSGAFREADSHSSVVGDLPSSSAVAWIVGGVVLLVVVIAAVAMVIRPSRSSRGRK